MDATTHEDRFVAGPDLDCICKERLKTSCTKGIDPFPLRGGSTPEPLNGFDQDLESPLGRAPESNAGGCLLASEQLFQSQGRPRACGRGWSLGASD